MGLFNSNRGYLGLDYDCGEIVANENYTHEFGFGQMLVDNAKNDMAIFEALIAEDFKEVMAVQEGVEYVNEASLGGFFDKIKEFLKKVWEKIKGIIKSFTTKFIAMFIRDNKELVKKYAKDVRAKDLSKMKYKWRQLKASEFGKVKAMADEISKQEVIKVEDITVGDLVRAKELEDKIDSGEYLESLYGKALGNTSGVSEADVEEEFRDYVFGDLEEEEGLKSDRLGEIISTLENAKDALKDMKDVESKINTFFTKSMANVEKVRKNWESKKSGTENEKAKGVYDSIAKGASIYYKQLNIQSTACTKGVNLIISALKEDIKQARRVFVQAAAFNPKAVKEDAILFEAIGESAAEFDVLD